MTEFSPLLVPGTNHPSYYHIQRTSKCGLRDFEAFEAHEKGLCFNFPTPHYNNQSEVEQGYDKH